MLHMYIRDTTKQLRNRTLDESLAYYMYLNVKLVIYYQ